MALRYTTVGQPQV